MQCIYHVACAQCISHDANHFPFLTLIAAALMAADKERANIDSLVAHLAERLQCDIQTYRAPQTPRDAHASPGPQRYLFPAGPYSLGLSRPGDTVHLYCLTDNSSNTFWEYVAEKLEREDLPKHDCVISDSNIGSQVKLHYCSLPAHFDLATVPEYGFPSFTKASVRPPRYVEQNLAAVQDTWYLHHTLKDDIPSFCNAYQSLRSWAEATGIFSEGFGLLGPDSLLWILFHAWTEAEDQQDHRPFDFGVQAFVDRDQTPQSLQAMLTASCRSTYAPPPQIVTENQVLIAAKIAHLAQNPGSLVWTCEQHYLNFCRRYQTFLTAKAECWSPKQRDAFRSQVVKELRHLPERLSKSGFLHEKLRVWPHAFSSDCRSEWLYIFGLETVRPDGRPVTDERNEEMAEFVGALDLVVDKSNGRVEFNLCKQVGAKRVLDDYRIETGPPTTDRTSASSPSGDKTKLFPSPERLPPASEVLSRLRWDPTHTCFDYEVGYLDRFEGLMWLPLEQWGKAVEEEDFIPAHRIRVLRRMNGNGSKDVVWDREKRFCDLGG